MSKTKQVMKLTYNGKTFAVIKHTDTDVNPYWLYLKYHEYNSDCRWTERKKLLVKYDDMESILYHLVNFHNFK